MSNDWSWDAWTGGYQPQVGGIVGLQQQIDTERLSGEKLLTKEQLRTYLIVAGVILGTGAVAYFVSPYVTPFLIEKAKTEMIRKHGKKT